MFHLLPDGSRGLELDDRHVSVRGDPSTVWSSADGACAERVHVAALARTMSRRARNVVGGIVRRSPLLAATWASVTAVWTEDVGAYLASRTPDHRPVSQRPRDRTRAGCSVPSEPSEGSFERSERSVGTSPRRSLEAFHQPVGGHPAAGDDQNGFRNAHVRKSTAGPSTTTIVARGEKQPLKKERAALYSPGRVVAGMVACAVSKGRLTIPHPGS